MLWVDYNIEQQGEDFTVKGDWHGEVMGVNEDGTEKSTALYKPGDVFVVNNDGWLQRVGKFEELMLQHGRQKSIS